MDTISYKEFCLIDILSVDCRLRENIIRSKEAWKGGRGWGLKQ